MGNVFDERFLATSWDVAPAYDMLFTVDLDGPRYFNRHSLSIGIKTDDISADDLRVFASENDIGQADAIINEVSDVIREWPAFAKEAGVSKHWIERINEALSVGTWNNQR